MRAEIARVSNAKRNKYTQKIPQPCDFGVSRPNGDQEVACNVSRVVIAGWTGRDPVALEKHIPELEALDVSRPSSIPISLLGFGEPPHHDALASK
jgi:hypothetical protein